MFAVQFDPRIYNKEEIVTFIAGCFASVVVLSYFQLKYSAIHFPSCLVISNQFLALMYCSLLLKQDKSYRDDFESNRPQWIYILTMQFTLIMLNVINQITWKRDEAQHQKNLANSGLFPSVQERGSDRTEELIITLLEATQYSKNMAMKTIFKMLYGRGKSKYFVKLITREGILIFVWNLNFVILWSPIFFSSYKMWLTVTVLVNFYWVVVNAFFVATRLGFKIVHSIKKNDEKVIMFEHSYSVLFCLNWMENVFAYGVYRCYLFLYPHQVSSIAKVLNYVALAATILYKLLSCLNRKA